MIELSIKYEYFLIDYHAFIVPESEKCFSVENHWNQISHQNDITLN